MHRALYPILPSLLLLACGGADEGSICDSASQHVTACTGQAVQTGAGVCSESDARLAEGLLGLSCNGVQSLLANTYGKADWDGCWLPWLCPGSSADQPCGLSDMVKCQGYCDTFSDPYLRVTSVTCEVQDGTAHCQCNGYWLPWKKSDADPPSDDPGNPEDPPDDDWP